MMSIKSKGILISGASGWLGKEVISLIGEEKVFGYSPSSLRLLSSDGRSISLANGKEFLTSRFIEAQDEYDSNSPDGFIHLAFLTRDKLKTFKVSEYIRINMELISKACQQIERSKPKWIVLVSSGAIYNRRSGEIENNIEENPYGFCKRLEELLLCDAAKKVGANIVIGRLWGASGKQMQPNREYALSDFIESARLQNDIRINSGGEVFRRYVDAGEFMEVLIKLAISGDSRVIDSGGDIVEIADLSRLVADHFPGTSVSRSEVSTDIDDYYPKSEEFAELAKTLGVKLSTIKDQVGRTVESHIRQSMN